jgi:DNA-binding transcriptional ArsR family regulator
MAASKTKRGKGIDERFVKAIGHPLRLDVLRILNERTASPSEIAKELNEGISHVSYHVKVLKEADYIELVKTEPRRGAVEHYYRATSRALVTDDIAKRLPLSAREGISVTMCQALIDEMTSALEAGTFDSREDRHLSWMPIILDEEGWRELMSMLEDSLNRAMDIQAASASRLGAADKAGFSALVAMMGFEAPQGKKAVGPAKKPR